MGLSIAPRPGQPSAAMRAKTDASAAVFTAARCRSLTLLVPVPAAHARTLVPEGFEIFAAGSGRALLSARGSSYERISMAGAPRFDAVVCEVGIRIEPPRGAAEAHFHVLALAVSDRRLAHALRRRGIACATSWLAFDERRADENRQIEFGAPWARPMVALSARVSAAEPGSDRSVSVGWVNGPRGRVPMRSVWVSSAAASAVGSLWTSPRSTLGMLIGGEAAPAAGRYLTHTLAVACDANA